MHFMLGYANGRSAPTNILADAERQENMDKPLPEAVFYDRNFRVVLGRPLWTAKLNLVRGRLIEKAIRWGSYSGIFLYSAK
jgi:hypothetical protein